MSQENKHVPPANTTIPPYRIQYNPVTNRIDLNITVHVDEKKIALDIKKKYVHFDTLKSDKKYWMEVSYPYKVVVNPEEAVIKYDHSCLAVRIPIVAVPENFEELRKKDLETKNALKELKKRNEKAKMTGGKTEDNKLPTGREKLVLAGIPSVKKPLVTLGEHKIIPRIQDPNFGIGKPSKAKNPNRVILSNEELLKLARRAGETEIRNQQEKQIKRETKEELLLQQMEAREKRREEKKSKKKAIIESAKKRMNSEKSAKSNASADKKQ